MNPTAGSVWRKGDEERHVLTVETSLVNLVSFAEIDVAERRWSHGVGSLGDWLEWVASGAVQVYPPPAVQPVSGETVRLRGVYVRDPSGTKCLAAVAGDYFENYSRKDVGDEFPFNHAGGDAECFEIDINFMEPSVPVVTASVEPAVPNVGA